MSHKIINSPHRSSKPSSLCFLLSSNLVNLKSNLTKVRRRGCGFVRENVNLGLQCFCKAQFLFNNLKWFHCLWSSFVIQDQKLYCCQFLPKCSVDQWIFLIADRAPMGVQKGWIWAPVPPAIWCSEPVSRLMMIMYWSYLYPSYETVTKTYKLNYNETDPPAYNGFQMLCS